MEEEAVVVVMVLTTEFSCNEMNAKFKPPVVGMLPVYNTMEDAEKEWPGKLTMEIQEVEQPAGRTAAKRRKQ